MKKAFDYEYYVTQFAIRKNVLKCEGKHVQQVVYSTYHDALTQICFDCKVIRSNIKNHMTTSSNKDKGEVTLKSQGDNNWKETFDSEENAYWFLYGIISKKERYGTGEHDDFAFDCEDDMITWTQDGKKKYCAGWHWSEYSYEEQIVMPDGQVLYEIMSKLES